MKILYHHRTQSKDGQAVHIEELIQAFRDAGHEVVVVEPGQSAETDFGAESKLLSRIKRLLPQPLYEAFELGYNLLAYPRLQRALREHRPDFLYERYNLFLVAGAWLRRRHGIPLVLEVNAPLYEERRQHGGLALASLARWSERFAWRNADVALPVTAVLGEIMAAEGVARERLHVVPNGINPTHFSGVPEKQAAKRALGIPERHVVLGFTGFVRPWHGLDRVIELMADPRRSSLYLLVAGDGPIRGDLEARAKQLGVADRMRFLGVVGRERIPAVVASFDIALQPAATAYASPLKLFEYMALGAAIVAPDQPNIREILADQANALLFAPGDPDAMAKRIERLSGDAELRDRLGQEAKRTLALRGLFWRSNAERIVRMVSSLPALAPEVELTGVGERRS